MPTSHQPVTADIAWQVEVTARREQWRAFVLGKRVIGAGDCWEWPVAHKPSSRNFQRYGLVRRRSVGGAVRAHRLTAALWGGFDLTSDQCVLHRCDNPPCCNPEHLFIGTRADNMADKVAKGRQSRRGPSTSSHCVNGHEYAVVGMYMLAKRGRVQRQCKACVSAQHRRTYLRKTRRL